MKALLFIFSALAQVAVGQIFTPQIPRADWEAADREKLALQAALDDLAAPVGKLVFPIAAGPNRIGHALSIGGDRVIAKWSDCEVFTRLLLYTSEDIAIRARPIAVYPEHDLAILRAPGLGAPAVRWGDSDALEPGSFLAAIDETGKSVSLGVMSVENRSLRADDQGFLGIQVGQRGDQALVEHIQRGTAADRADLEIGDLLLAVNGKEVSGFYEFSAEIRRIKAGEKARLRIGRYGREKEITVKLGGREPMIVSRQIREMNRMSGTQSNVRDNFPEIIQTDLDLEAYHSGLPVINLDGKVVGIVIARAGRISTLLLPASVIQAELRTEPHTLRKTPLLKQRQDRAPASERLRRLPSRPQSLRETLEGFVR